MEQKLQAAAFPLHIKRPTQKMEAKLNKKPHEKPDL
jgi:hypothetical protein